jgi:hypothetical protein
MTYVAARAHNYRDQARAHFRAMFGDRCGWMELSAIEGDPDDRQRCCFHQGWFEYTPARLDTLMERIATLVKQYGNVYTSITLYAEPKRDKAQALPGRVVFVDDAQPGSYTYTLQTSKDREQAFIILDQDVDTATREGFARRLSRAGADKSGWDITQLARVPGTFNTKQRTGGEYGRSPRDWKRGSGHRVTLIPRTLRTYSAAALDQRAPKIETEQNADAIPALDWPEVEQWLGNLGPLMHDTGIPRRFKPHQQSYRVLTGDVVPVNDEGEADESTRRSFIARGCAWARYPHDAAAAILWRHTSAAYITRKGSAWHKADIARVIAKEYAIVAQQVPDYQIRPITEAEMKHGKEAEAEAIKPVERKSRARHDRPQRFTPASLYARYRTEPSLCGQPRKRRAADLEISTATLDRLEGALRSLGLVEIETAGRGHAGRVALRGVINIPEVEQPAEVLSPTPTEAPIEGSTIEQNDEPQPVMYRGNTPAPGGAQPPAAPAALTLSEAARHVFDQLQVDPATGEKRRIYTKHARAAIAELGKWPERWIDRAIADERMRRRIAAILLDIQQMKPNILKAQIRLMERLAEKSRREETNLYKFAEWAAREMRAELATRPATRPAHKPCEALVNLRTAAADVRHEYEQRMLAEIEPQRRGAVRQVWPAATGAPSGGVCSPQPTPGTPQSLLASIRAIHAQRAG